MQSRVGPGEGIISKLQFYICTPLCLQSHHWKRLNKMIKEEVTICGFYMITSILFIMIWWYFSSCNIQLTGNIFLSGVRLTRFGYDPRENRMRIHQQERNLKRYLYILTQYNGYPVNLGILIPCVRLYFGFDLKFWPFFQNSVKYRRYPNKLAK